ncbi:hypothetical protein [Pelagibacterium sp. H642]|uniref:hypothetical protein n=1 Tax=Pelagibacterium sp. H642 TaxID=1881069 RepID=UPI002815C6F4|nr:hypothetical protein [Pelagibacterium sp. H642]WMT91791.1 hypothetical protein NO934_05885 [Pelagibacterium sp. H642]
MSVSGPQAMRALDDALRDIRREEDDITKRIARANERIGKLRETELGQLRALATVRLSPEVREELAGTLGQAETRARDMLKEHAAAMAEMEKTLGDTEAALAELTAERQSLIDTVAARQAEIDALGSAVDAALAADSAYQKLVAEREEAERTATEADRKADQAEADREAKGEPYRSDPLFTYLWDRQYGTSAYKAGNITRMLDQWVARLVGYTDARANYAMLTAIPERLREHAERLADDVGALDEQVAQKEQAALDAAGGREARMALEAARTRVEEIDAEILSREDAREELTERQKQIAEGGDPAFGQAVEMLAEAIWDTGIEKLLAEARATRTEEDDAIVVRLEDARRRIAEEQLELDDERARLKTLESRRRELEDIEFEFKKARYDDPRSRFREDRLVGDLLTDFLKGGMTAATYWDSWRRSQDWTGTSGPIVPTSRPRSSRSKSGFPIPPGGFSPRPPSGGNWGGFSRPRGGGFGGGGGFKTGGSFGGGTGFKTGGGF